MDLERLAEALARRPRDAIADQGRARAAVLVALYGPPPDYRVLYTVRTNHVEHHKGEISFPGGGQDPGDASAVDTALRETEEELGIDGGQVEVLGLLDDVLTRTAFVVTPVVGRVQRYPCAFRPAPLEVAEVLEVPLSHLRDPANHTSDPRLPAHRQPPYPSYQFGRHIIFGATARVTARFLGLLAP